MNWERELPSAVKAGKLPVLDPLTFGPHPYPRGAALAGALVALDDLRTYLAGRLTVIVEMTSADPTTALYAEQKAHRLAANCYEIFEAAEAIAKQLGLNKYNEEKLRDDMAQAAFDGKLTVRSPRGHDQYAPTTPPDTTYIYYYLTTPDDVNKWANSRGFTWRWEVQPPTPQATPPVAESAFPEPSPELRHWKMRVQSAAAEHWKALRASGANPTVSSIVDWMANWCRDNNVLTDNGINPSSGYLRTHVLGGGNWTPPT